MNLSVLTPRNIQAFLIHQLRQAPLAGVVDACAGPVRVTDQESETYFDVGAVPPMQLLSGKKITTDLRSVGPWTVTNQLFGTGMRVKRNEILLDKTGRVEERARDLVGRFNQHWYRELIRVMKLGESTACYDGQFFFDTDHSEGKSGTQSNDIGASATSATAPTAAEMQTAIFAAINKMLSFLDDQGEPAYDTLSDFALFCPPSFTQAVAGALNAVSIPGGQGESNALLSFGKYSFTICNEPLLATAVGAAAWTTKFALVARNGRAFMRQHQRGWEQLVDAKLEGSDYAQDTFGYEYQVTSMRQLTYQDWKSAVLTTFA